MEYWKESRKIQEEDPGNKRVQNKDLKIKNGRKEKQSDSFKVDDGTECSYCTEPFSKVGGGTMFWN